MPNHFHFLLRIPPAEEMKGSDLSKRSDPSRVISEFMKRLTITYAMKFNRENNRVGPILQGRFKAKEADSDELVMHICRYIHINPVMAGLVTRAEEWPWSDLGEYYRFNPALPNALSKPRFVMEFFDHKPDRYRDFVESQLTEQDIKIVSPLAIDPDG
jgi:REP element-mobilizing transposase RayT